jgi:hypothetical protein
LVKLPISLRLAFDLLHPKSFSSIPPRLQLLTDPPILKPTKQQFKTDALSISNVACQFQVSVHKNTSRATFS